MSMNIKKKIRHYNKVCNCLKKSFSAITENGNWEPWMSWSGCSASCGFHGFQTRTRSCAYPPPNLGGLSCEGPDIEIDYTCANKPCHHGKSKFCLKIIEVIRI